MKITSWTVEGAKKQQLTAEISLLKWTHKPNELIFLEKMINECNRKNLISNLGFQTEGISCRITLQLQDIKIQTFELVILGILVSTCCSRPGTVP